MNEVVFGMIVVIEGRDVGVFFYFVPFKVRESCVLGSRVVAGW